MYIFSLIWTDRFINFEIELAELEVHKPDLIGSSPHLGMLHPDMQNLKRLRQILIGLRKGLGQTWDNR
jgi:hypothetical protein